MKLMTHFALAGLTGFVTLPAFAGFNCTSVDDQGSAELAVVHAENKAEVTLLTAGEKLVYSGTFAKTGSSLHKVTDYVLTDAAGAAVKLSIVEMAFIGRGGCGRAGCDGDGLFVPTAVLEVGAQKLKFNCDKTIDL